MYDAANFTLKNMVEMARAFRLAGDGETSMEAAARNIVRFTYEGMSDPETGERAAVMVRCFKTHPYGDLPEYLQETARHMLDDGVEPYPEMKCLVLLASIGIKDEWNSRKTSRNHQVIPLPSEEAVRKFPMIHQIIKQVGLAIDAAIAPDPAVTLNAAKSNYNILYIPDVPHSPYVTAQEEFVKPYGVQTIIGPCGMLPSGNFFAGALFSRADIPPHVAQLIETLSPSVRVAFLPFDGGKVFDDSPDGHAVESLPMLQTKAATLEDLLKIEESAVIEQAAKLEQAQHDLAQANEDVKQFAYIVSHDLRAPLVNLRGFAGELKTALKTLQGLCGSAMPHLTNEQAETAKTVLHEDIPEAIGFIESSAERMDHFIGAVLKLSHMGRQELSIQQVNLRGIIDSAVKTMDHQIEQTQTEVCVGELPEVWADPIAMEQIVGNILGNAVKYMEKDRPGKIEITADCNAGHTTLTFRDNGRGIAKQDMAKVFAPFRRAGRQDTPGEGMGMAYVQLLVRRLGGDISCESEPGVGTTFTVTLPGRPTMQGDIYVGRI